MNEIRQHTQHLGDMRSPPRPRFAMFAATAGPQIRSTAGCQGTCPPARPRPFADFFRGPTQRAHGDHHSQHCRHDPEPRQRIGHRAERGDRLAGFVMRYFHVHLNHLVQIKRIHVAGTSPCASCRKNEVARVVVLEEFRILLENVLLSGPSMSPSNASRPISPRLIQNLVAHLHASR